MKHGSLFSGIGGFDLAAEWMGWENVFHCEWNEFGRKVLNHYWPNAKSYEDITQTDFSIHRGEIDILTGGFPCQPYSQAGKRLGKEDERHLWPEMLRAIREIKPTYVVGENVRGLVNWSGGLVFEEVCADLEAEGYEVQPFLLPACGKDAPHRRDRIWFVAHANGSKQTDNRGTDDEEEGEVWRDEESDVFGELLSNWLASDSNNARADEQMRDNRNRKKKNNEREGQPQHESWKGGSEDASDSNSPSLKSKSEPKQRQGEFKRRSFFDLPDNWETFPTEPPICGGNDGLPERLDGISFPKWRNESIKAYGNAIVPQVAFEIFKAIQNLKK